MTHTRQEMDSPVLIVEPYADYRAEIAATLSRQHYRCDSVGTVRDALLRIRDNDYHTMVIDIDQQSVDELLLAAASSHKIVLITELENVTDARYRVLRKPFDRKQLLDSLE